MWNKSKWFNQLLIITLMVLIVNLVVFVLGSSTIYSLISGYLLNIVGLLSLLLFAVHKIYREKKINNGSIVYFTQTKFTIKDGLLVLFLLILSNVIYVLLMKIEFIHFFKVNKLTPDAFIYTNRNNLATGVIIFLLISSLAIGVFAEELYFRLYLFENQYEYFKDYTWIVNGLSWSIFHIFSPANFLAFLPTCLLYSYIYQKRKNVWITICAHFINNSIALYPVIKSYL